MLQLQFFENLTSVSYQKKSVIYTCLMQKSQKDQVTVKFLTST